MARMSSAAANPIAAVELLAILVATLLWTNVIRSRAVIGFVDNEPAKHAMVRGGSPVEHLAALGGEVCSIEILHRALCYWERVPSQSNIADPPSRGEVPPTLPGFGPPLRISLLELGERARRSHPFLEGMRDVTSLRPGAP